MSTISPFGAPARIALAAAALLVAAPLALTGCSSPSAGPITSGDSPADANRPAAETSTGAEPVSLEHGWAKAGSAGGMTGLFGTLENRGAHDLTIAGITSDAAKSVELHEVTSAGVMQRIEGDVTIPADGAFELAPGANHIMLMGLARELLAGDEVTVIVSFSDGSSAELTALVKDYSGANEDYDDVAHEDHGATGGTGGDEDHGSAQDHDSHEDHGDAEHAH